jgi:predicted Zn-dependent peptidase
MLPINFAPKNEFQDFQFKAIVHPLAHEHAEVYVFLKCLINFENKPIIQIFENLFFKYGGILYDRLRDELGLVYGIQSDFDHSLQVGQLYLTCEIEYVEQIIGEIDKVFSDFDKVFIPKKFEEFKNIITKKTDISRDSLKSEINFATESLTTFGIFENYESYSKRLQNVTIEQMKKFYTQIQTDLQNKKVVLVSKDPKITEIETRLKTNNQKINQNSN